MPTSPTDAAARWLLHSGVQNPPGTENAARASIGGAFNAWFDPATYSYSYVYTEITGYAVTTLTYLFARTHDAEYLTRARQAGDWLLSIQTPDGAMPTAVRYAEGDFKSPHAHTFDVGMVLNGLVCLYNATQDQRYLTGARKAADWLIRFQNADNSLAAHVTMDGKVEDTSDTWSTQPGSYHAKIAIGFLNLFRATEDVRYRAAAVGLCEYALTRQQPDGQFYTYGKEQGTNLHPHCYSAEGLWVAGQFLSEERYTEAARRATEWALAHTKEGIVPRHKHETFNYNERVDILAQAYRLFVVFGLADAKEAQKLKQELLDRQYQGEIETQRGGFIFGKMSDGRPAPHINCWVTMFALQALMMETDGLPDPFFLV